MSPGKVFESLVDAQLLPDGREQEAHAQLSTLDEAASHPLHRGIGPGHVVSSFGRAHAACHPGLEVLLGSRLGQMSSVRICLAVGLEVVFVGTGFRT